MQEESDSKKIDQGREDDVEDEGRSEDESRMELDEKDEEIRSLRARVDALEGAPAGASGDALVTVEKALEEEQKKSADYLTRLRYLQADFENHRKRVEREIRELEDFSVSALMKRLLPMLDDLELATSSAEKDKATSGFAEGVGMISKNLASVLRSEGLEGIDAVGKPFDPERHEAIERVKGSGKGPDIVVAEIRKGYIFKDRVLRPSLVKVGLTMNNDEQKKSELQ
jgi:molecular chaperone GrpE